MSEEAAMGFAVSRRIDEEWAGGWPQTSREFEALVDLFLDRMVRSAFRRLGDLQEAEDVVQDVFVKAYADREKLRRVQQVGPYLHRMVANACSDRIRRSGRRVLSFDELGSEDIPDQRTEASQQLEAAEEIRRIEQLLTRLPGRQAEVIRLRVLDELSLSDIAQVTGCNLPTVKSRLHYGLQKLRRMIPCAREESL